MKKILLFVFGFFTIFLISIKAEEYSITSIKEEPTTTSVKEGFTMRDNFNIDIHDNVVVEQEVNGSGLYVGQNINVDKNINGIGLLVASKVTINSKLENGLLIAKSVVMNGVVDRDLFVATGSFNLGKESKLNRDLFLAAESVVLEGNINRDAFIGANTITVKTGSTINGNVRMSANKIVIEDGANILGILKYNDNASVNIKNKEAYKIETYKGDFIDRGTERVSKVLLFIYKVVSMILLFLLLLWLFPKLFKKIENTNKDLMNYPRNLGKGLIVLILMPLLALFLIVVPYTSLIGLITLVFYFMFMYFSFIVVGYLLGELLRSKVLKKPLGVALTGSIGILILQLLCIIPLVSSLVVLIGLGTIYTLITDKEKEEVKSTKKVETKKKTTKTK